MRCGSGAPKNWRAGCDASITLGVVSSSRAVRRRSRVALGADTATTGHPARVDPTACRGRDRVRVHR
jgi:hypothetical protein